MQWVHDLLRQRIELDIRFLFLLRVGGCSGMQAGETPSLGLFLPKVWRLYHCSEQRRFMTNEMAATADDDLVYSRDDG